MFSPLLQRLQDLCLHSTTPVSRHHLRIAASTWVNALPALGPVLYVPMHPHASSDWAMPRGLLVGAMQLAPLLQVRSLVAASVISVDGPREWIDGLDRHGCPCARLYLLPDTDYLAWDALLESGDPISASLRRIRHSKPACAQLLRFDLRRIGGLDVLGADHATRASSLSTQLAGQIARAEALAWQPQMDS